LTLLPGNVKFKDIIGREGTGAETGTGSGVRVCAVPRIGVETLGADSGILFHITLGCCRPEWERSNRLSDRTVRPTEYPLSDPAVPSSPAVSESLK
jgi:hypothetical protein